MRICFPVQNDAGINSLVYNHFGSAPMFIIFDTDTKQTTTLNNGDLGHQHGSCNPLKALGGEQNVDGIVVGGIGAGALAGLNRSGLKVFKASAETVVGNISLFEQGALPEFSMQHTCGGHGHGHGEGKSCCH